MGRGLFHKEEIVNVDYLPYNGGYKKVYNIKYNRIGLHIGAGLVFKISEIIRLEVLPLFQTIFVGQGYTNTAYISWSIGIVF